MFIHTQFCFQVSAYIECCKYPPASQLPTIWQKSLPALLSFLQRSGQGRRMTFIPWFFLCAIFSVCLSKTTFLASFFVFQGVVLIADLFHVCFQSGIYGSVADDQGHPVSDYTVQLDSMTVQPMTLPGYFMHAVDGSHTVTFSSKGTVDCLCYLC